MYRVDSKPGGCGNGIKTLFILYFSKFMEQIIYFILAYEKTLFFVMGHVIDEINPLSRSLRLFLKLINYSHIFQYMVN